MLYIFFAFKYEKTAILYAFWQVSGFCFIMQIWGSHMLLYDTATEAKKSLPSRNLSLLMARSIFG
jgi:hypothetical protein